MTQAQPHTSLRIPTWLLVPLIALVIGGGAYYVWWSLFDTPASLQVEAVVVDTAVRSVPGRPQYVPLPQINDPGPTLITLQLNNTAPEAAFAQFAKLAGYDIRPASLSGWTQLRSKPITVNLVRKPFWPALMEFCHQTGAFVQETSASGEATSPGARSVIYVAADSASRMRCPAVASGSFMIVLRRISHTATVNLDNPKAARDDIHLDLTLLAEPKLSILEISNVPEIEQAVDDAGNSLAPPPSAYRSYTAMSSPWMSGVPIRLNYPAKPAKRIARLAAAVHVVTAKMQSIEIPDILNAKDITRTIDNTRIVIHGLTKTAAGYSARVTLADGDSRVKNRFLGRRRLLRLVDAKGMEYGVSSIDSSGGPEGLVISTQFSRRSLDAPGKLVVSIPTEVREIRVPFTFTDLPLP